MHLFDVYVAVNKDLEREIEEEKQTGVPSATDQKAKEVFCLMEEGKIDAFLVSSILLLPVL